MIVTMCRSHPTPNPRSGLRVSTDRPAEARRLRDMSFGARLALTRRAAGLSCPAARGIPEEQRFARSVALPAGRGLDLDTGE
ncbi:hypothetical protein Acy02nite_88270 [Actinoplanes cyaneus]|uniref:Uncharacterized protein n=1 Tax=Actinoplanes cyaneus TaxID=52696 RepID=A0A919ITW8_9ACTN|nr:hypothetical protein [Actinoplanes cyaneus]GID70946.1 hypothetical protein Acy02nite_88270 [Actinoplanes cyaneus]